MGVCELHWPDDADMRSVKGKRIPKDPPSVFCCPKSFQRQTSSKKDRNIESRKISFQSRTTIPDELSAFESSDHIPNDFNDFAKDLPYHLECQQTIINRSSKIFMVNFDNNCRAVEMCITIASDFSITAF